MGSDELRGLFEASEVDDVFAGETALDFAEKFTDGVLIEFRQRIEEIGVEVVVDPVLGAVDDV